MAEVKIKSFTDLSAWKEGDRLVLLVYKITDKFPSKKTYSLIDQMRKAASGFYSKDENIHKS